MRMCNICTLKFFIMMIFTDKINNIKDIDEEKVNYSLLFLNIFFFYKSSALSS